MILHHLMCGYKGLQQRVDELVIIKSGEIKINLPVGSGLYSGVSRGNRSISNGTSVNGFANHDPLNGYR